MSFNGLVDYSKLREKFESKISPEPMSGCWLWAGSDDGRRGYGRFRNVNGTRQAHRISYEMYVGPIPAGLEIDHKCKNPSCVNPQHLRPVTREENMATADKRGLALGGPANGRRNRAKTHCAHGHAYTPENTIAAKNGTARGCKTCHRNNQREYVRRLRAAI